MNEGIACRFLPHFAQSYFARSHLLTLTHWAKWDWAKWEDTLGAIRSPSQYGGLGA